MGPARLDDSKRRTLGLAAALVAAIALLAYAGSAPAQTAKPKITGLGQEALPVKAESGKDDAVAYLSVLNAGDASAPISVAFQAASSDKVAVSSWKPTSVGPGATRVAITLTGLKALDKPAEGQLVVTGGQEPVARAVSITPAPQGSRDWASTIFWFTVIVFGVLLVGLVVRMAFAGELGLLGKLAPGPKWSFSSWATTLTAVGAILGTVIGGITLPAVPRRVDKQTLIELNLIFGVLLVVGPFVFQAIRARPASATRQEAGLAGYTWSLLFACSLTAAAVIGELATLALMGSELTKDDAWRTVIVVAAGLLALLALNYFWRTTWELATTDWEEAADKAAAEARKPQRVIVVSGTRQRGARAFGIREAPGEDVEAEPQVEEALEVLAAPPQAARLSWNLP